ncbi:COPII coat complex component secretory 31 isoform X2 [Lycorma delicatula]|uniref:COPII coat complex component secretory 31 isoform X2 n=1 Tax=Lycorma delicatula TaxID=130591 RepID=UPI003F511251
MKVKELDRTVNIAWSPVQQQPVLLAAGTAAQQLDASFSTSAALEIYGLNLGEPGLDMELKASLPSQFRFHRIVWGGWGFNRDNPYGVIVGGCDGGHLQIYSASRLLAGEESLIVSKDSHTGPVRAIDFNSYQTNILATGASDSEIFIWDLNNTTTPMSPGAKLQPNEDVLWVAWNKQVQHILASTFAARCVIFDLRKNEPIIKLSDNTSRVRWKAVEWHPAVATQLCLASEDDSNPVVQLWDLRFATTPIKTLEGHSKGLLSIAWCAQDPDLLIGSGKDNKILCWNPNANEPGGEVVCELVTSYQWNFEVAWCPRNPSLVASCSFDGHASIHSLTGGQQQVQTSNKIADSFPGMEQYADAPPVQPPVHGQLHSAPELRKAPKWLRRPAGASFGFGGKLLIFNSESRSVTVSQVISEPELLERSHNLQVALASGRFDEICSNKTDSVWSYVAATLQQSPRAAVKKLLGFTSNNLELNKFLGEPANARLKGDVEKITDGLGNLGQGDKELDFDSFSNSMGSTNGLNYTSDKISAFDNIGINAVQDEKSASFIIPTGDDVDGMIGKTLLAGNIELAVELCLQKNRMADAIILAMTAGSDLLAKTQHRYFQQSKGHLSELIGAVVTEEWSHVVSSCNLSSWKEALVAVLTYSKDEELPSLCETLGQRLEMEGGEGIINAEICYVVAKNLSKLIKLRTRQSMNLSTDKLQELVEMVVVLQRGVRVEGGEGESETAKLMSRYAELLAAQGELATALSYLHDPQQDTLIELHDRLQYALGQKQTYVQKSQPAAPYYHAQTQSIFNRRSSAQSVSGSWPLSSSGVSQPNTPPANVPKPTPFTQMYHPQHQPSQMAPPPVPTSKPLAPQQPPFSPVVSQPSYSSLTNRPPSMITGNSAPLLPQPSATNVSSSAPAPPPAQHPPSIFNPPTSFPSQSQPFNPPGSIVAPPPPPPTNAVPSAHLHRSSPSPGPGVQQGRQKYVLDPSVNAGPPGLSYRNQIPPGPMFQQPQFPQPTPASSMAPLPQEQSYKSAEFRSQAYAPQHTGPAGWNDPPVISSPPRNQPKVEMPPQNPITHPLYGAVTDTSQVNTFQSQVAGGSFNGSYGDPSSLQHQQQQQQQYQHVGYNQPPKPMQQTIAPAASVAPVLTKPSEPPRPKLPIPEEHVHLQTVFDELRNRCTCAANNPQSKRKLEEVARKLEMLYDALRESKLSPGTLAGLHQLVQLVQTGDYTGGLALHTQLISGPDFSQIASFMPGLKVLLQSALQLGVYLQ